MRSGALPHARLLSADRRDRVATPTTLDEIIAEMRAATHLRAAGPADRQRRSRLDGEEEARGLFLMADRRRFLADRRASRLLRFLTCGSVDDGKSTLIGRLLYEQKLIFDDQLGGARDATRRSTAPPATTSTSRCWSTAWRPSASRASPSTSPTAFSPPTSARSSSPTRPATSSTPATWRPAPPTPISPSSWSTRARAC